MRTHLAVLLFLASGNVLADATVVRTLKLLPQNREGLIEARSVIQVRGQTSRRELEVVAEGPIAEEFAYPRKAITLIALDKRRVHTMVFPNPGFQEIALSKWPKYLEKQVPF